MPLSPSDPLSPAPRLTAPIGPWQVRTLLLALVVLTLRLLYLAFACPYTLVGDEAHYWEWSRRLDLSYYTKGPGVAWTIAAGTWLWGDTELGVRFFAPIFAAILTLATAGFTADVTGCRRAGWYAALLITLAPVFQSLAILMTIDGPYAALWALALWAGWRAAGRAQPAFWPLAGLLIGVACLYKYTALLILPGLLAFALLVRSPNGPDAPAAPRRPGLWLLTLFPALALGALPILLWNHAHGWPTLTHLKGHLGLAGGDSYLSRRAAADGQGMTYSPLWTLNYIGTQLALLGPGLVAFAGAAVLTLRRRRRLDPDRRRRHAYLLWAALPIFAFYLLVSFQVEPEGNWALAGAVAAFALAGAFIADEMPRWRTAVNLWRALPHPRPRRGVLIKRPESFFQVCWHLALGIGLVMALVSPRLDLLAKLPGLDRLIPVSRFSGADLMAADAAERLRMLEQQTGLQPFILATHYARASLMAFYLPGHPTVYCCQSLMPDGRVTQYDFFTDTNLRDPDVLARLRGRPALLLEAHPHHDFRPVFQSLTRTDRLRGAHPQTQPVTLAKGFLGFPPGLLPRRDDGWPPNPSTPPSTPPSAPLSAVPSSPAPAPTSITPASPAPPATASPTRKPAP